MNSKHEGEHRQHRPEWHADEPHEDGDHHGDGQAKQQLPTDVAAHHAIEALDEERDVAPVRDRRVARRPFEEAAAIQHEVHADHADDDGVEDDGEQPCRHRHHVARQASEEVGQVGRQAADLILGEAKALSDSR